MSDAPPVFIELISKGGSTNQPRRIWVKASAIVSVGEVEHNSRADYGITAVDDACYISADERSANFGYGTLVLHSPHYVFAAIAKAEGGAAC